MSEKEKAVLLPGNSLSKSKEQRILRNYKKINVCFKCREQEE